MKKDGIVAIFLAAGKSSRMGTNKLSLPLSSTTIGSTSLLTALHSLIKHVVVVTKKDDSLEWMDSSLFAPPYSIKWSSVICDDAEKGQAHSLKRGLQAAMDMKPKGIMILLADQPFLSKTTINQLIHNYTNLAKSKEYLASCYDSIPRPPIIFSPQVIPRLLTLQGDIGARKILRELEGSYVEFITEREFLDIDTKEDYDMVLGGKRE